MKMNELQESNDSRTQNPLLRKSKNKQDRLKAISTVIGSTVLMLWLGSVYVTGVIQPYIRSYYQIEDPKLVSLLMPCTMVLNMVTVPIGSALVQRNWNPKYLVLFGATVSLSF